MTKVGPIIRYTAKGEEYRIVGGKSYIKEDGCYLVTLTRVDTNLYEVWKVPAKIEGRDLSVSQLDVILGGPWPDGVGPYGKIDFEWKGPWGRKFLKKYGNHPLVVHRRPL